MTSVKENDQLSYLERIAVANETMVVLLQELLSEPRRHTNRLPPLDEEDRITQAIALLMHPDNLSHREIARRCGIPESTLRDKPRYARAFAQRTGSVREPRRGRVLRDEDGGFGGVDAETHG